MPAESIDLLQPMTLTADWNQDQTEAVDLGGYTQLHLQINVLVAGTAGTIKIQHATRREKDWFEDIAGATVALNQSGPKTITVSSFSRFIRLATDGNVAGTPVAAGTIVAKG